jgi:antitoxin component YwqK of YwqJK toxin-antitoxin module
MNFILAFLFLVFGLGSINAQADGEYEEFYESGKLKLKGQYKDKIRVGEWISYYETGEVSQEFSYSNGEQNKIYTSYYKNGKIQVKVTLEGDKYINRKYFESGNLEYEREDKTGYFKSYLETGELNIESKYIDWQLDGEWKQYYKNGQLEWNITYKEDYKQGNYKQYYQNGDLKLQGSTVEGRKNGTEQRYGAGNILEWEGTYKQDQMVKSWTNFDANGAAVHKLKFKNGLLNSNTSIEVPLPTILPQGVRETVPIYPGCENLLNNLQRSRCLQTNLAKFIIENYDKKLLEQARLVGPQNITVNFKIDNYGNIIDVDVKTKFIELVNETERVIKNVPKMRPGTQIGKPVTVPYRLPLRTQTP